MKEILLFPKTGPFAEDKDLARDIRLREITPTLKNDEEIILNFEGVESTTQSFIHALISELIREYGSDVLDKISFKKCNDHIQKIISIVVEYMQV